MKTKFKAVRTAGILLASAAAAPMLMAQTVPDQTVPASGLDLPANLTVFGKVDPNVRKPTAIVNDHVITGTDVDHRLALILAMRGLTVPAEQRDEFRLGVLRQLIDETLQIQDARSKDITLRAAELDNAYARVARNMQMTPQQLNEMLAKAGSSTASMRRQIEGELAWSRLLQQRVEVNVSEAEVQQIIERMNAERGSDEYHVMEIYLASAPQDAQQKIATARGIIDTLRQGNATFDVLAATHSDATTRSVGGDLGWVRTEMLPAQLTAAINTMQVGQIAGPIEIPGGYSIIYLRDKRQVLMADPRDAVLSLRQVTLNFAPGTTQASASSIVANFAKATQAIAGCGDVQRVADSLGAEVVDNDQVRVRDLPPQLQEIVGQIQIGQATPPFGSVDSGVRTLVLCGRDDPPNSGAVNAEQLQDTLARQRTNLRAQRMLRDLRRDAVVEYR